MMPILRGSSQRVRPWCALAACGVLALGFSTRAAALDPRCPAGEWIGTLKAPPNPSTPTACPATQEWSGSGLLTALIEKMPPPRRDLARRLGLESFCRFTYIGQETDPARVTLPPEITQHLERAAPDCVVVRGMASEDLAKLSRAALEQNFLAGVDFVAPPTGQAPATRLAILDTQATGTALPAAPSGSRHGFTLAHLAQRLACPSSSWCPAQVTTRLALPVSTFTSSMLRPVRAPGGEASSFGALSDLAAAVVAEVEAWEAAEPKLRHLVLNLSLGWDPATLGETVTGDRNLMGPGTESVFAALEFAACRGALSLAAAGNREAGPEEQTGPLLPAAWEAHPPTRSRCAITETGPGRPVVFAAAGLTVTGEPLVNARPKSLPPRAAYGDHATLSRTPGASSPLGILTGSSVATMVTAATAASGWSLRPNLDAATLIRRITAAGRKLAFTANFPAAIPAPRVRKITYCAALKDLCGSGIPACAAALQSLRCTGGNFEAGPLATSLADFGPDQSASLSLAPEAGNAPCAGLGPGTNTPCQLAELPGLATLIALGPQPEDDPCPGCSITGRPPPRALRPPGDGNKRRLLVYIPPEWSGGCASAFMIELLGRDAAAGERRFTQSFSQQLCRGSSLELGLELPTDTLTNLRARLTFVVSTPEGPKTVETPVLVVP